MPRTEEEYRQQLAEDAGPQPDELVRLQMDLDAVAAERDAALREVERLRAVLEEVRGYTLNVAVCAEAYNETESAHLWQEAADIADKALG